MAATFASSSHTMQRCCVGQIGGCDDVSLGSAKQRRLALIAVIAHNAAVMQGEAGLLDCCRQPRHVWLRASSTSAAPHLKRARDAHASADTHSHWVPQPALCGGGGGEWTEVCVWWDGGRRAGCILTHRASVASTGRISQHGQHEQHRTANTGTSQPMNQRTHTSSANTTNTTTAPHLLHSMLHQRFVQRGPHQHHNRLVSLPWPERRALLLLLLLAARPLLAACCLLLLLLLLRWVGSQVPLPAGQLHDQLHLLGVALQGRHRER